VTAIPQARMLLSHNFDIADGRVPALTREQFAAAFVEGFSTQPEITCHPIDHPHWIVEILFPNDSSAQQIGEHCAQILATYRRSQGATSLPAILILGGIKTTPPTSDSPTALQPGQWGVDVVETPSAEAFLAGIAWETAIATKPANSVFKVEG
jgi:Protein of unknown function (DUF2656)